MTTSKTTRAALYLKVSTGEQTTENQRLALQAVAEKRGWTIVEVFEDAGISGTRGRDRRPGLDAMLKAAARAQFDVVLCWSIDRLGRSLADLLSTLSTLRDAHADLFLHQQNIDTSTPSGRAFLQMLGVFSEFEAAMIRSRVHAGLDRARANGVTLGRPKVASKVEAAIRAKLADGVGVVKTGKALGVGTSVVQRVRRELAAAI